MAAQIRCDIYQSEIVNTRHVNNYFVAKKRHVLLEAHKVGQHVACLDLQMQIGRNQSVVMPRHHISHVRSCNHCSTDLPSTPPRSLCPAAP